MTPEQTKSLAPGDHVEVEIREAHMHSWVACTVASITQTRSGMSVEFRTDEHNQKLTLSGTQLAYSVRLPIPDTFRREVYKALGIEPVETDVTGSLAIARIKTIVRTLERVEKAINE